MQLGRYITTFGLLVYSFGMIVGALTAALLLRSFRRRREPLLFWTSLCFLLLALENCETFLDYVTPLSYDLSLLRLATALVGVLSLIYGFVWAGH